jgi:hypothetical protein
MFVTNFVLVVIMWILLFIMLYVSEIIDILRRDDEEEGE